MAFVLDGLYVSFLLYSQSARRYVKYKVGREGKMLLLDHGNVILSCGHEFIWSDYDPYDPENSLPFIGKRIICPYCNQESIIKKVEPEYCAITTRAFPGDNFAIFYYDFENNTWGFNYQDKHREVKLNNFDSLKRALEEAYNIHNNNIQTEIQNENMFNGEYFVNREGVTSLQEAFNKINKVIKWQGQKTAGETYLIYTKNPQPKILAGVHWQRDLQLGLFFPCLIKY
jgi:hypothetical protein